MSKADHRSASPHGDSTGSAPATPGFEEGKTLLPVSLPDTGVLHLEPKSLGEQDAPPATPLAPRQEVDLVGLPTPLHTLDALREEGMSPPPKAPTQAFLVDSQAAVAPHATATHVDPSHVSAAAATIPAHARAVAKEDVMTGKVVRGTVLRTSAEPRAANDLPITRRQTQQNADVRLSGAFDSDHTTRGRTREISRGQSLSDVQVHLQQMRMEADGRSLVGRFLQKNAAHPVRSSLGTSSVARTAPHRSSSASRGFTVAQLQNQQVFRRKFILLGYQEVGKTSLRKCFESEPFFFKSLPEVRTTTGVEVQEKSIKVEGDTVDIILSDFAGQESYHSHTFFLTERSIFLLVWKLSAVEQDFQSNGINAREETRLQRWIAEVFAKYPHARIVLVATHLDELRVQGQRSVEMILNKVEKRLRGYIDDLVAASTTPATSKSGLVARASSSMAAAAMASPSSMAQSAIYRGPPRDARRVIVGNFAVSCKTRAIIAAGDSSRHLSGGTIRNLLLHLGMLAREDCITDREYPAGGIPGRHVKLIECIRDIKRSYPAKLLLQLGELVQMAVSVGIDSEAELLQVARLMHSWDIIYVFHPFSLEANTLVLLHPRWLNRMAASLFSYAHLLRTPLHMRSMIGGLEYQVSSAERADLCLMRRGFLRWPLARILFRKPLSDFLHRTPDDADIAMCLEHLCTMQLVYPVQVQCDDLDIVEEETPIDPDVGLPVVTSQELTRYFIPSLAPYDTPQILKKLAPVLLHQGVRVRFEFNLLPDELWWRFQCALHPHIKPVTVYQPAADAAEDEDWLLNGLRLREADEEHSRWRDSLWLMGSKCRVLVYREEANVVSVVSAESEACGSEDVLQAVEDAFEQLLTEYRGVFRHTHVACPNQDCGGWLDAELVASSASVICCICKQNFESKQIVSSGVGPLGAPRFSHVLLAEAGELLASCLSYRSCLHMCIYLGIPYKGPSPIRDNSEASEPTAAAESEVGGGQSCPLGTHVEYFHALDKVVQAVLFRSWMQRTEEQDRRRRMLEEEPTLAFL